MFVRSGGGIVRQTSRAVVSAKKIKAFYLYAKIKKLPLIGL